MTDHMAADPAPTHEKGDLGRFFATWLRHPVKMGAVAPSSRDYCATMVREAATHVDGPILELGAGLGCVTRALLEAGVERERIISIEYDREFADALSRRFPGVDVVCGDGFDIDKTLGAKAAGGFATILFAIPVVSFPQAKRQALMSNYFSYLRPGGNVTQLSYLLTPPVKAVPGVFTVRSTERIWKNVPPARVWVYERDGEAASNGAGQTTGDASGRA